MSLRAGGWAALGGHGPAVSSQFWPRELRAAFPGPRRRVEAWVGEGAAFARYVGTHGPLFLKYLPPGWRDERAYRRLAREAAYLRDLAPLSPVPHAPLLHSARDPARWRAHLLTRDLTDETTGWGAFESDAQREAALLEVARLLARHHAFWRNRPELRGEWGWHTAQAVRQVGRVAADATWTPAETAAVGEVIQTLPTLLAATQGVTLAHGDIHAGQVLWPLGGGPPVLIDYGQTHAAPLGEDLAHLLHVRLDTPDRARLGPAVREAYRAELAAHGLPLSSAQLAAEERAGLALNVLTTARQARREVGTGAGSGVREALGRVTEAWRSGKP
jgi:hypothetical protein